MTFVFEMTKVVFFLCVIAVAVLTLKGGELFDAGYATELAHLIFPAFFVLGGVMIGWIIAVYFSDSMQPSNQLLMKGFIVGLLLGALSAVLYILYLAGGSY